MRQLFWFATLQLSRVHSGGTFQFRSNCRCCVIRSSTRRFLVSIRSNRLQTKPGTTSCTSDPCSSLQERSCTYCSPSLAYWRTACCVHRARAPHTAGMVWPRSFRKRTRLQLRSASARRSAASARLQRTKSPSEQRTGGEGVAWVPHAPCLGRCRTHAAACASPAAASGGGRRKR